MSIIHINLFKVLNWLLLYNGNKWKKGLFETGISFSFGSWEEGRELSKQDGGKKAIT